MTETEKVANALGLSMGLMAFGQDKVVNGRQESTGKYNLKVVRQYLDSPAGREAVRDKVRELWRDYQGEYGRREVAEFENVGDLCGQVQLLEWDHGGREGHTVKFSYATIILARQAALMWLSEQAEKGGGK